MNAKLLSKEELFSWLHDSVKEEEIQETVKEFETAATDELVDEPHQQKINNWLSWAEKRSNVKCINKAVPEAILPEGYSGILTDVKVEGRTRRPDDYLYNNSSDLREKVARGNSVLNLTRPGESKLLFMIFALRKFSGGLGDDDHMDGDNFTWMKYFIKPMVESDSVVCLRKANGEAAHVSARWIEDRFLICVGSKNVHMLITCSNDIEFYGDSRYSFAREIASTLMRNLDNLSTDARSRLLSFFHYTGFTAVLELLSPKHAHVESLDHLTCPHLKFIAWTTYLEETAEMNSLCRVSPAHGLVVAKALGLEILEYDIIPASNVDDRMSKIRRGYNYEGEVLYFLDQHRNVIGVLKKKTTWYIIVRAIREKIRNAMNQQRKSGSCTLSKEEERIKKRIKEIQKWIGFDDQVADDWRKLGCHCLKWVLNELKQSQLTSEQVGDNFPVVWKKFLESCGKSDNIEITELNT